QPACSVVVSDTTDAFASPQVLLDQIPFTSALGTAADSCPVAEMAWSPDGTRLALTLAASNGVELEVLHLRQNGQAPEIESRNLLPGAALEAVDNPNPPSLFWSSNGKILAALSAYRSGIEDGLFLLPAGKQTPLTEPNL